MSLAATTSPSTVLLVEDDASLRQIILSATEHAGYAVTAVGDGEAAIRVLEQQSFEVLLLDLGLPLIDGWRILERVQPQRWPSVIVISARGDERDKVRALDLGADDYLAKPFGVDELLARIRAVLRRRQLPVETARVIRCENVSVDLGSHTVMRNGEEVLLSPTEYCLIAELARHAGLVLDHRTLLQRVWGSTYADERNYLWTFVRRLRAKLEEDAANPRVLVTVGRQGYRFGPPPSA